MTNVKSIRIGDKDVYLVMNKGQAIWPERASLVQEFIANAKSEGYTVDEPLLYKSFQTLHPILKRDFSEALILGAYKEGSIAAMKDDGTIISYPFQRNSTKTYWDKDGKMKLAEINVPTLDYDPLTRECKGYGFNRALTNLWTESTMDNMALVNKLTRGSTNFNLGEPLDTGLIFEGYSGVNSDGYTSTAKWVREVSKTYTLLFYVQRSDKQEFKLETSRITIRLGRAFTNDSNIGVEKKYIGNGVWRYKLLNADGGSDNRSAINRVIDSTQTHDVTLTGYNIFEGDVSIDEPYIPTNGSIVTTVSDLAPRTDNPFRDHDKVVFYGDINVMVNNYEFLSLIGSTDYRYGSINLVTNNRITTNLGGVASSLNLPNGYLPSPPVMLNIKMLSQRDFEDADRPTKMYFEGNIYSRTDTQTLHSLSYGFYINTMNHDSPFKYIKSLVGILDKNVTDSEGLEITS